MWKFPPDVCFGNLKLVAVVAALVEDALNSCAAKIGDNLLQKIPQRLSAHKSGDSHILATKPRATACTIIKTIFPHIQTRLLLARIPTFWVAVLAYWVMASVGIILLEHQPIAAWWLETVIKADYAFTFRQAGWERWFGQCWPFSGPDLIRAISFLAISREDHVGRPPTLVPRTFVFGNGDDLLATCCVIAPELDPAGDPKASTLPVSYKLPPRFSDVAANLSDRQISSEE